MAPCGVELDAGLLEAEAVDIGAAAGGEHHRADRGLDAIGEAWPRRRRPSLRSAVDGGL